MDRWLQNLQKVRGTPPASTKPALNVESAFRGLLKVSDDDDDFAAPTVAKLYINDPDAADVFDPTTAVVEKAKKDKFGIPEFTAPHADGIEVERCGEQLWKHHWNGGTLTSSELWDPKLPGGYMRIKGEGRHNATAHFASVDRDLESIDLAWGELLGGYAVKPEVAENSKKKATSETFMVAGEVLAKGEIASRMLSVLAQIRSFCVGEEAALIEKSVRALDFAAFGELATPVLERMNRATELIRSSC